MSQIAKAIVAAIGSAGAGLVTAAAEDGIDWSTEGWVILGGALVVGAAVWRTPNAE